MKKSIYYFIFFGLIGIMFLMILNPDICKNGAVYGLMLSSNVIIPSIFPFSVLVLFMLKTNLLENLKINNQITLFLLSLIGGYPVGAKLLNEAVSSQKMNSKTAEKSLNYCINAGPAFIILAIGKGVLGSKLMGYILFISHILSSFLIMLILKPEIPKNKYNSQNCNLIDSFVLSVSDAASSTFSICSFVVVFSVIINFINYYSKKLKPLKYIGLLLEVVNATTTTKNIILISFLLGFSGICIWFQIWSVTKSFKINYIKFIIFRILHGSLSAILTALIIKIFNITLPTLSNGISANYVFTNYTPQVAISLIIMGLILIISLYTKNYAGNLLEDLV